MRLKKHEGMKDSGRQENCNTMYRKCFIISPTSHTLTRGTHTFEIVIPATILPILIMYTYVGRNILVLRHLSLMNIPSQVRRQDFCCQLNLKKAREGLERERSFIDNCNNNIVKTDQADLTITITQFFSFDCRYCLVHI